MNFGHSGTVDTVGRSRNQIWVPNPVPNAGNKEEKSITRRYAVERQGLGADIGKNTLPRVQTAAISKAFVH
jgi:hypothetical protein